VCRHRIPALVRLAAAGVGCGLDGGGDEIEVVRFREEPAADLRLHLRAIDGAGSQDHRHARPVFFDPLRQVEAIDGAWHIDVGEHDIDFSFVKNLDRLSAAAGLVDLQAAFAQIVGEGEADHHFVLDDQDDERAGDVLVGASCSTTGGIEPVRCLTYEP